jgi:uncharacterized membrane protein YadS
MMICARCLIDARLVKPREAATIMSGDALCGECAIAALGKRREAEQKLRARRT